jgi:hypothetical protein
MTDHISSELLASAALSIPPSSSTVTVKALLTFEDLIIPHHFFLAPALSTHSSIGSPPPLNATGFTFLIEHAPSEKKVIFDLGIRKNRSRDSPKAKERTGNYPVKITQDVADQLMNAGVDLASIDTVIWRYVASSLLAVSR